MTENLDVSSAIINTLFKRNILLKKKIIIDRFDLTSNNLNKSIDLTFDQQKALNNIKKELDEKRVVLFKGVTSSGKTEIYIELIKEIINKNLNVLFLVPEIALTTQLVLRLEKIFS